jgi:hypothetical protein
MSRLREIREAIDKKLDYWEASATALEEQLQQTREQALAGLEVRRETLKEAVEDFKSEVAKAKGISEDRIVEMLAKFDHLKVQLTLGRAEARDAFGVQRKKIQQSIAALEAAVDRHLDAAGQAIDNSLDKAANKFINAALRYEAEAEVLQTQLAMKKDAARVQLEKRKSDLLAQIKKFKSQVQGKRNMTRDKSAAIEKELSAGISQIKQAFKRLSD